MIIKGKEYTTGLVRDPDTKNVAHLYAGGFGKPGMPMCKWGWNRDKGTSYSIWRNQVACACKICLRRAEKGLLPVLSRVGRIVYTSCCEKARLKKNTKVVWNEEKTWANYECKHGCGCKRGKKNGSRGYNNQHCL